MRGCVGWGSKLASEAVTFAFVSFMVHSNIVDMNGGYLAHQ